VTRPLVAPLALCALALLAVAPEPLPAPGDTRPLCPRTTIAVVEQIDSSRAHTGDRFTFRTVDEASASDGTPIPAESIGYGIIAVAKHAERAGKPGYLVLEARFVGLPNGSHVPIVIDRLAASHDIVSGGTANAPVFLGVIPYVNYGVGAFDFLHHGKDATIPFGTRIPVFIGDDVAMGTCRQR
jgi:hypothetical protein